MISLKVSFTIIATLVSIYWLVCAWHDQRHDHYILEAWDVMLGVSLLADSVTLFGMGIIDGLIILISIFVHVITSIIIDIRQAHREDV